MNATIKTRTHKTSRRPASPPSVKTPDSEGGVENPASNATQPLEKPAVRRKAHADQSILQEKGPNALPVSDYPIKEGVAANTLDRRRRGASGS